MKASIAITLIAAGALLIVTPIVALQWQLARTANFYEQHGTGTLLPEELRPAPYRSYEWVCSAVGALLALAGCRVPLRPHAVRENHAEEQNNE